MARPSLKKFRRIVVKVGSSLLIDSDAGEVRASWLAALAADLAKLHGEGLELLIVSSGSIALGRSRLKLPRGTLKLEESQAAAAVGQIALARIWSEVLGQDPAQRVPAAPGRERKDDSGQRSGLSERLGRFDRQRQADASRNEIPAVHYCPVPWTI